MAFHRACPGSPGIPWSVESWQKWVGAAQRAEQRKRTTDHEIWTTALTTLETLPNDEEIARAILDLLAVVKVAPAYVGVVAQWLQDYELDCRIRPGRARKLPASITAVWEGLLLVSPEAATVSLPAARRQAAYLRALIHKLSRPQHRRAWGARLGWQNAIAITAGLLAEHPDISDEEVQQVWDLEADLLAQLSKDKADADLVHHLLSGPVRPPRTEAPWLPRARAGRPPMRSAEPWIRLLTTNAGAKKADPRYHEALANRLNEGGPWAPLSSPSLLRFGLTSTSRALREMMIRLSGPDRAVAAAPTTSVHGSPTGPVRAR